MAGKGFKVEGERQLPPRGDGGRFVPPPPPKVVDDANARGVEVLDAVQAVQAPEHPTPGGRPHVADELPPIRRVDPPRPPFRLK
jgi:hypothetical protein